MDVNTVAFMFLLVAISFCFQSLPVATVFAEQLSETGQYWENIILEGRPSLQEKEQEPIKEEYNIEYLREKSKAEYTFLKEKHRMWLLIDIVVSTPILLAIVLFCLKNKPNCSAENLVNAVGLVLVVEGTMFIAVSAATTEQLTAPIGILGAIAGYLFGSAKRRATEEQH